MICGKSISLLTAIMLGYASILGCASRRSPGLEAPSSIAADDGDNRTQVRALWASRTSNGAPMDFCLGSGDQIEITVFHFPEMSGLRNKVSSSGFISLPLLGEVQAAGLTERELQDNIASRLRNGIMKNPNVNVFVTEYLSQQVSVTGAVARPGLISLTRDRRTVSQLLSEAGGLSEQAGGKILFYPASGSTCPTTNGSTRVASAQPPHDVTPIEIDLNQEYGPMNDNPLNLPVIGGDALVVNRGKYFVDGWVTNPAAYDITPGATAFGALTAAGGALFAADLSSVVVWRTERGGNKRRIDVDLNAIASGKQRDVTIEAGDVVSVPASALRMIPYGTYWLLTNVIRVGAGVSLTGF